MTITTDISGGVSYAGNGASTFDVPWRVDDASHLALVVINDASLAESTPEFTLVGEGSPTASVELAQPLESGFTLLILPDVPATQPVNLRAQRSFNPEVVEAALDRVTMIAARSITRASVVDLIEQHVDPESPSAALLRSDILSGLDELYSAEGSLVGPRSLRSKIGERPSVLDFIAPAEHAAIAAGTSTFDATEAFALALSLHDHVLVPPGEYWVSQIVLDDHQTLAGYGWGVSAIKQIAGTDAPLVRNADQVNGNINIALIQLRLDGNKAEQTPGSNARGIYFVACAGVYMQGVWVYDCRDHGCMSSGDATNWTVIGCRFTDCGSEAHITAGGAGGTGLLCAKKSVVVGCRGARNYLNGFKSSGDNLTYIGCVAEDNNGGFDTGTVGGLTNRHMRFISCAAVSNEGYGFAFGPQTSHIEMHACNASENGKAGVYILQNAISVKIFGGYFMNNGQAGSVSGAWPDDQTRLDGIAITDSGSTNFATDIEIRGVTCTDNQTVKTQEYGIFTRGGPEGVRIIDCDLRNNKTGGLLNLHEKVMEVRGCLGLNTDPAPNLAGTTITGSTSSAPLLSSTVKEDEMHAGAVLRLAASGTVTGTAGTKLIRIVTGSTSQIACNFAAGETGSWSVDAEIVFNSRSSQTWKITASKAGVTTTSVYSVTMNFGTADRVLSISAQLGNAADSIICNQASIGSLR